MRDSLSLIDYTLLKLSIIQDVKHSQLHHITSLNRTPSKYLACWMIAVLVCTPLSYLYNSCEESVAADQQMCMFCHYLKESNY